MIGWRCTYTKEGSIIETSLLENPVCYQFMDTRPYLCLWNAESPIAVEQLPSCVKDRLQGGRVRCVEEEVRDTHTQTHTHKHSLPPITDHYTAAVLNTMSQLCDGIQCRLTARTGGSVKGEKLAVDLGKGQTDWEENRKTVHKKRI